MALSVTSYVARDTKPLESDELVVLLVSTGGKREMVLYRDLEVVKEAFPDTKDGPSKIYRKVEQLFNQGKTTLASSLYRKVKIVGFDPPESPADLIDSIESYRQNDDEWQLLLTDLDEREYQETLLAFAESTEPTLAELLTGIEDHRKFYFGQTTDKTFECTKARGAIIWVNGLDEEGDAACIGNVATFYPVRRTWKFKRPDGVTVADLSEGEKNALDDQHINYITREYKREFLKEGVCTDGEFIDVVLGADYIAKRIRDKEYDLLLMEEDIPYTDDGFTQLGSVVVSALNDAMDNHIIARDPESGKGQFTITIPTRASATDEQARKRIVPPIKWSATVEGSAHQVDVQGVLTVSLQTNSVS